MTLVTALIAELQQESRNTRKLLARVPAGQFSWKPHEKSMSLIQLAAHIAEIPGLFGALAITTPELDFAKSPYKRPAIESTEALLAFFDENLNKALNAFQAAREEDLDQVWSLRSGETVFITLPRKIIIRNLCLNHLIHHRGQLSVYLRLVGVPIPGMYGPSADEGFGG